MTVKKFSELSGLTEEAIRQYMKKGIWLRDVHWCKAPNGRIFIVTKVANQWIAGKEA